MKGEQLAVTVEGIATEVDQLQLAETGQGGQGLQLVLLQVQALQLGPQAREGPGGNLQGEARPWVSSRQARGEAPAPRAQGQGALRGPGRKAALGGGDM